MNINDSSDSSSRFSQNSSGSLCKCGKNTKVTKSWTNENPGRRFLRCEIHGFCRWVDEEKPHGWQRTVLLEARDEILILKENLRAMRKGGNVGSSSSRVVPNTDDEMKKLETEIMKRDHEIELGKEREKLLRQFLLFRGVVMLL